MKYRLLQNPIVNTIPLVLALGIPFLLTFPNRFDRDMWYHIKLGEYMATHGHLLHSDVFAYTTAGRPSYPTEWLFQILLYWYQHFLGMGALGILVGCISAIEIGLLFLLIRYLSPKLNPWLNLVICLFYSARIANTASPRPFGAANILLLIWTGIIFLYVKTKKPWLLFLFPVLMYVWANFHGSFIVGCLLLSAFAVTYTMYGVLAKQTMLRTQGIFMGIAAGISWIATILPPLFFDQYKVLQLYFTYRQNALYIIEWNPLSPMDAEIYTATVLVIIVITGILYRKDLAKLLLLVPLLPLLILPFNSQRHVIVACLPIALLLGFLFQKFATQIHIGKLWTMTVIGTLSLALIVEGNFYFSMYQKLNHSASLELYPVQAAQFIKTFHLQGHMLNSYNFGGYLLYQLYPQQKVFVDGWADPYLCCELTYLENMARSQTLSQEKQRLNNILHDYDISFVIVTRSPLELDMNYLMTGERDFSLVFWDDNAQIYVKNDGKNTNLLHKFKLIAASPYGKTAFDAQHIEQAKKEYERMAIIADSAKSRNALGVIAIDQKNIPQAITELQRAIAVDPTFLPPYLNLGEIYIAQKNYSQAIDVYQQAVSYQPSDALPYLRLAALYIQTQNDANSAKQVLQLGIASVSNPTQQVTLQNALLQLSQ
ncbi:MAG: tetratricopeptide repeat protein [Patescibacteria group bacterium]|nr:tetratricopeptide repeat protein [Patescibacteria group bacterium]MDE2589881.1 tetratricopeptide repeat protein [Patescibacteria group bacterium]